MVIVSSVMAHMRRQVIGSWGFLGVGAPFVFLARFLVTVRRGQAKVPTTRLVRRGFSLEAGQ